MKKFEKKKKAFFFFFFFFFFFLKKSFPSDAARVAVFGQISLVVKKCFPGCMVEMYGSSATGLGLPNSDLDLCVSGTTATAPWSDLAPFLKEFGAQNLQIIASSRVPIIKLRDPIYHLNVDISFALNNASNYAAPSVELVKSWVAEMDRYKVFFFFFFQQNSFTFLLALSASCFGCQISSFATRSQCSIFRRSFELCCGVHGPPFFE